MARYRVVELSYFNERIVEPGEEVEFTGIAGSNLALISNEAEAKAEILAALQAEAQALGINTEKNLVVSRLAYLISEVKQRQTT
jgi:hypothetical protein